MNKIFIVLTCFIIMFAPSVSANETYSVKDLAKMGITANSSISKTDLDNAKKIMLNVQTKTAEGIKNGKGPFYAEIYDRNGNFVVASSKSVVEDKCC